MLGLSNVPISDLSVLLEFQLLEELGLTNVNVSNFSVISSLTSLKDLNIDDNNIRQEASPPQIVVFPDWLSDGLFIGLWYPDTYYECQHRSSSMDINDIEDPSKWDSSGCFSKDEIPTGVTYKDYKTTYTIGSDEYEFMIDNLDGDEKLEIGIIKV